MTKEFEYMINANDVLCGRGGEVNNHPGNKRFRSIVASYQHEYLGSHRKHKAVIAGNIVAAVKEKGGRFLKRNEQSNAWVEVTYDKATLKSAQALREGLAVGKKVFRPEKLPILVENPRTPARLVAGIVIPDTGIAHSSSAANSKTSQAIHDTMASIVGNGTDKRRKRDDDFEDNRHDNSTTTSPSPSKRLSFGRSFTNNSLTKNATTTTTTTEPAPGGTTLAPKNLRAGRNKVTEGVITSVELRRDVFYEKDVETSQTRLISIQNIDVLDWTVDDLKKLCSEKSITGFQKDLDSNKAGLCELIVRHCVMLPSINPLSNRLKTTPPPKESIRPKTRLPPKEKTARVSVTTDAIESFNIQHDVVYNQNIQQKLGVLETTRLLSLQGIPISFWNLTQLKKLCVRCFIPTSSNLSKVDLCEAIVEKVVSLGVKSADTSNTGTALLTTGIDNRTAAGGSAGGAGTMAAVGMMPPPTTTTTREVLTSPGAPLVSPLPPAPSITQLIDYITATFNILHDIVYDQNIWIPVGGHSNGRPTTTTQTTRLISIRGTMASHWSRTQLRKLCTRYSNNGWNVNSDKAGLCEFIVKTAIRYGVPSSPWVRQRHAYTAAVAGTRTIPTTICNPTTYICPSSIHRETETTAPATVGEATTDTVVRKIASSSSSRTAPTTPAIAKEPTTDTGRIDATTTATTAQTSVRTTIHDPHNASHRAPAPTAGAMPPQPSGMPVTTAAPDDSGFINKVTAEIIASVDLRRDVVYDEKNQQFVGDCHNQQSEVMTRLVFIKGIHIFEWQSKELLKLCRRFFDLNNRPPNKARLCEFIVERAIRLGVRSTDTSGNTKLLHSTGADHAAGAAMAAETPATMIDNPSGTSRGAAAAPCPVDAEKNTTKELQVAKHWSEREKVLSDLDTSENTKLLHSTGVDPAAGAAMAAVTPATLTDNPSGTSRGAAAAPCPVDAEKNTTKELQVAKHWSEREKVLSDLLWHHTENLDKARTQVKELKNKQRLRKRSREHGVDKDEDINMGHRKPQASRRSDEEDDNSDNEDDDDLSTRIDEAKQRVALFQQRLNCIMKEMREHAFSSPSWSTRKLVYL